MYAHISSNRNMFFTISHASASDHMAVGPSLISKFYHIPISLLYILLFPFNPNRYPYLLSQKQNKTKQNKNSHSGSKALDLLANSHGKHTLLLL